MTHSTFLVGEFAVYATAFVIFLWVKIGRFGAFLATFLTFYWESGLLLKVETFEWAARRDFLAFYLFYLRYASLA